MEEEQNKQEKVAAVKALLNFSGQVAKLCSKSVLDIDSYEWKLFPDTVEPSLPGIQLWSGRQDDDVLFSAERQPLPEPPEPDDQIKMWVIGDWRHPNCPEAPGDKEILDQMPEDRRNAFNEKLDAAFKKAGKRWKFGDLPGDTELWNKWADAHTEWVRSYQKAEAANQYFNRLYSEYQRVEDSGMRLMGAAGSVFFQTDKKHTAVTVNHPIDVQAIDFVFDTSGPNPKMKLVWSHEESALFRSDIFNAFPEENFRFDLCNRLRDTLQGVGHNPLDPGDFLKDYQELANTFSPHSSWLEKERDFTENIYFGLVRRPVFWIQNRPSGIEASVRQFIEEIDKGEPVPKFMEDLSFGKEKNSFYGNGSSEQDDILSTGLGIDERLYLTKPANQEQLRISRLLERSPGVLVQGPPGTGKTHTIANLIGHLLAQGKKVLVTSQKPQALAVLKAQLPAKLQPLCISEVGDKKDVARTVPEFTMTVEDLDVPKVKKRIERNKNLRRQIIGDLREAKRRSFDLIHKEIGTQSFDGESWSLSKLGMWLRENEHLSSVIAFPVQGNREHFPLTDLELEELYDTSVALKAQDELALTAPLPNTFALPEPDAVAEAQSKLASLEKELGAYEAILKASDDEEALAKLQGIDGLEAADQARAQLAGLRKELAAYRAVISAQEISGALEKTAGRPFSISVSLNGNEKSEGALRDCSLGAGQVPDSGSAKGMQARLVNLRKDLAACQAEEKDLAYAPGIAIGQGPFSGSALVVPEEAADPLLLMENELDSRGLRRICESWCIDAAVAGIYGDKQAARWSRLLEGVKEAVEAADQYEQVWKDWPVEKLSEDHISMVLDAIRQLREAGADGKPSFFQKMRFSSAYKALDFARVKGKAPCSFKEFDSIELYAALMDKRASAERQWDSLVGANHPELKYREIGDENFPEYEISSRICPQIEKALRWWSNEGKPLAERLRGLELKAAELEAAEFPQTDPKEFLVRFERFLSGPLANALAEAKDHRRRDRRMAELRAKAVQDRQDIDRLMSDLRAKVEKILQDIKELAEELAARAESVRGEMADLARERETALGQLPDRPKPGSLTEQLRRGLAEDAGLYRKAWDRVSELRAVKPLADRRVQLLLKLSEASPEWARAIRERRTGFCEGPSKCPARVQDAWKWLRLNGKFEEYLREDLSVLQDRCERLNANLMEVTSELVADMAWCGVSEKVQGTQIMQTLNAWLAIVKKIGKGTGKNAEELRRKAREKLKECNEAVPVWIMSIERALAAFTGKQKFDVVIVDEASQSDVSTLPVLFLGKKVLIVGDEEQVSPMAIGVGEEAFKGLAVQFLDKGHVINWTSYFPQTSLYDLAKTTCTPLMLREHFRCVPEIIGFCNQLSYGGKIMPLRDASLSELRPAIVPWRVSGERQDNGSNPMEAEAIVRIVHSCLQQPEYKSKTFGIIVMRSGQGGGKAQIALINNRLLEVVGAKAMKKHRIRVGISADFQGDERDVVLLSLVDSPADDGTPLRMEGLGKDNAQQKRWNVAVSRAKDQLWVVHSFDPNTQLKPDDLRRQLFNWISDPTEKKVSDQVKARADSQFEVDVASDLIKLGYAIEQQHKMAGYSIDIVVSCKGRKAALECDGDAWHSDEEQIQNDMQRQAILERLGWHFVRLRGGEYYRDPKKAIDRIRKDLARLEVYPEDSAKEAAELRSDLLDRVKAGIDMPEQADLFTEAEADEERSLPV